MRMLIETRDLTVVQLVAQFDQLSSQHIRQLVFHDTKSDNPADRSLSRLVERRMLARIERRLVGGSRGGSGQYVYILGLEGHKMFRSGRYIPTRVHHPHTMSVANCFVMMRRLEREGRLTISGYLTEPDCHVTIHGHELKPDLYVVLQRPGGTQTTRFALEIDQGSQGKKQILGKLTRYWKAYQAAKGDEKLWPQEMRVIFVAVHEGRAAELKFYMEDLEPAELGLFRVVTHEEFERSLAG